MRGWLFRGCAAPRVFGAITVAATLTGLVSCTSEEPARVTPSTSAWRGPACDLPAEWVRRIARGTESKGDLGSDLILVARPPYYVGSERDTGHSGPQDHLQEIPIVLYGPGHIRALGEVTSPASLASIAPTVAELLDFDMPTTEEPPLAEALLPDGERPRLVVTVVVDGGGWNVLHRWPDAWPNLARLMARGTTYVKGSVGSSPSITPSSHTTIGTGVYPKTHGVTGIVVRDGEGLRGSFTMRPRMGDVGTDPRATLERPTLAELFDRAEDNKPIVTLVGFGNYTLGMIGRGAGVSGGDKDIAMYTEDNRWITERAFYELPDYLSKTGGYTDKDVERVDRIDGIVDGKWRGHTMEPLMATPAFSARIERTTASLVTRERMGRDEVPDLLYLNFKPPDYAGHLWNMTSPEQRDAVSSVDRAIGGLKRLLDRRVGEKNWVLALTADHGQTPIRDDSWPISMYEMRNDAADALDHLQNGAGLFEYSSQALLWVDHDELEANDLTSEQVASFITEYTIGENASEDTDMEGLEEIADERPFAAVFPIRRLDDVVECSGASKMPADGS